MAEKLTRERQTQQRTDYDTLFAQIVDSFSSDAISLLSDKTVLAAIEEEKTCFVNAEKLAVPAQKLVRNNTARYVKNMLRRHQAFPPLYFFLSYLSESSFWVLLYGILLAVYRNFFSATKEVFPFLFGLLPILAVILYLNLSHFSLRKLLLCQAVSDSQLTLTRKRYKNRRIFYALILIVCTVLALFLVYTVPFLSEFYGTLFFAFAFYVVCMLLSGIHNVVYNSHIGLFFTLSFYTLTGKTKEKEKAAGQFVAKLYLRFLADKKKTAEDLKGNEELSESVRQDLHARTNTQRIYLFLAFLIFAALCVVLAVVMLQSGFSVALLVYLILSAAVSFVFIVCFVTANYLHSLSG